MTIDISGDFLVSLVEMANMIGCTRLPTTMQFPSHQERVINVGYSCIRTAGDWNGFVYDGCARIQVLYRPATGW